MGLRNLLEKASISRRDMLKGMGAVVTAASVAGCSNTSDDETVYSTGSSAQGQDYQLDTYDGYAFNTGPFNCGSKCVQKFYVRNGRITSMVSAGAAAANPSESCEYASLEEGKPMQFRACVRGYSYIQRVYQPDRLKYPLLQTGEKGNLATFKRITWDEAFEKIGAAMKAAYDRFPTLGYIPVLDRMGFVSATTNTATADKTYIAGCSNASNGNFEAAKMDSVGTSMVRNSRSDNVNSKFTIFWGADPTRHSNHENGSYWTATKAKENGVPYVTISPVCTDQAVAYSNTISVTLPASFTGGAAKTVKITGWIPIRPGTDGALALAMCYVLYRKDLFSKDYLTTDSTNRKCFGFFKGDSVTSIGKEQTRNNFTWNYPDDATKVFKGETYTVPENESFEEILMNLENSVADGGWAKTTGSQKSSPTRNPGGTLGSYSASANATTYAEVLDYATRLTGVPADTIEALVYNFASVDAAKIDAGCGPQRQYGGAEWCWLVIAFTVLAGHVEKKGGGLPMGMGSYADNNAMATTSGGNTNGTGFTFNIARNASTGAITTSKINVMDQNFGDIVLSGRDGRSEAQFIRDNKLTVDPTKTNGVSIDDIKKVEIDMYTMSASNRLITQPNVNKVIEAFKKIPMVVVCDQVMTPSAAYANIVLPAATHLEDVGSVGGQGEVRIRKQNAIKKTMYDSKRQAEINNLFTRACQRALGLTLAAAYTTPSDLDANTTQETTVRATYPSKMIVNACGGAPKVGSRSGSADDKWAEYCETGQLNVITPAATPVIGLKHHYAPGLAGADDNTVALPRIETSTGYINFWSPFWGVARRNALAPFSGKDNPTMADKKTRYTSGDYTRPGWRTPVADYVPVREGYEKFFEGGNVRNTFTGYVSPRSNRTYKLQFMTNKARNRAHTCQDNVAIIKDQFEQRVHMNPIDARARGINDGDMVYVYNDRGCTKIHAHVTNYIVPGVISVEHGAWYRASTDPNDVFDAYISMDYDNTLYAKKTVPIDVGGCENLLTDDRFMYDLEYINQTAGLHAGPVEVSKTRP